MQRVWSERVLPRMHNQPTTKRAAFLLFSAYADRKDNGAAMTEQRRGEQIAFPNQNRYNKEPQPARNIPTREQLIQAARRQAQYEANVEADPSYSGHQAGIHPEHRPYLSTELSQSRTGKSVQTRAPVTYDAEDDYEIEEDESYYDTRLPTSARRYQVSPEQVYQQGSKRYHVSYVDVPPRKSRQAPLRPGHERHTEAYEVPPQRGRRQGTRLHPLAWLGVFGIFLVLGWFGLNACTTWYQGVQDDLTYGTQRHFQTNAVVGHNDSPHHPSHFTAENNNGQIIVIELPGGDVSKAKIYQIETVPGNAGNPPVKLMFQDMNGDAKPDMIVQIGDGSAMIYLMLFNNGTEFVSKL
jgi:hypothetical protein